MIAEEGEVSRSDEIIVAMIAATVEMIAGTIAGMIAGKAVHELI